MQLKNDKRDERELSDDGRYQINSVIPTIQTKKNTMILIMKIKVDLTTLKRNSKKQ